MRIYISTLPHKHQRYDTLGDWQWKHPDFPKTVDPNLDHDLTIYVSETGNDDYNFLIGLHELVEAYLCKKRGISEESVDYFDMNYKGKFEDDPGLDPKAPYHWEHVRASIIEQIVATNLGVNWFDYDEYISNIK